jgi:F-type H+-transporting ATPase subunit delta
MKITPKQYALSLYELIEEVDPSNVQDVLKNFIVFLAKNNDLRLADKIISELENVWNDKEGIADIEVTATQKLDEEMVGLLKEYAIKWLNKKEININQKIDDQILGGIILKHKDMVIDGSLRKKIVNLKQELVK